MPVLSAETSVVPSSLFDGAHLNFDESCRWWVLHTRPRTEKSLARQLRQQQAAFFLPLYERRRRYQRRLVCSHVPLFPGYVFLLGDDSARYHALTTNLVAGCLEVHEQRQLADQLAGVHSLIQSGEPLTPEERLDAGMPAEITSGPLRGHRGMVIRRGTGMRLVIGVNFLQRGASIEVDTSMVRAL